MANLDPKKYSQLDYNTVLNELSTILRQKEGPLADFASGSYGRTILELFSGTLDANNYWLNQAFYESFLASANRPESVYLGARSLGYSIRRNVPSKALFGVRTTRTGTRRTINIDIKRGAQFSLNGVNLIAADNVKFTLTPDRNDPTETGAMRPVPTSDGFNRNILVEGEFRTTNFFSDGSTFQEFVINDADFSDWFGDRDPNYQEPDERRFRATRFTSVSTDIGLVDDVSPISGHNEKLYWRISRRGFTDPYLNSQYNELQEFEVPSLKESNYTVVISTNNDGSVKLEFADGLLAAIPTGVISVTYFATRGENGRLNNVFDSPIQISDPSYIIITDEQGNESDITVQDLDFRLLSDIQGGLNIESVDSIKRNASSVYSNLDTLGTLNSYVVFLKSRYGYRYARAFGEDIINKFKDGLSNIKYVNVVKYTMLKDLYEEKNGNVYLVSPKDYQVSGYKVPGLTYMWEFDYEDYRKQLIASGADDDIISIFKSHIAPRYFIKPGSELDTVHRSLNRRGLFTVEHSYVPPFVHHLDINMDIILHSGSSFTDIKEKSIQSIYSYLKDYTDFSSPVYKSNLTALIEEFPEVKGVNLNFSAIDNGYKDINLTNTTWFGATTTSFVTNTLKSSDVRFTFEYVTDAGTRNTVEIVLADQIRNAGSLSSRISNYISSVVYTNGSPSDSVSTTTINDISGFIWSQAFSDILKAISSTNQISDAAVIADIVTVMRTWDFNDSYTSNIDRLTFDTSIVNSLQSITEVTGNLYKYISYTLDYIKFVRNVLRYYTSRYIIDPTNGDAIRFKGDYEILQLRLLPDNITIKISD